MIGFLTVTENMFNNLSSIEATQPTLRFGSQHKTERVEQLLYTRHHYGTLLETHAQHCTTITDFNGEPSQRFMCRLTILFIAFHFILQLQGSSQFVQQ